jgi:hypothetical protein
VGVKLIIFGGVILTFAGVVATSPYWLFRELLRPGDEELPGWMGDARARKKRLIVIPALSSLAVGGLAIAAGLSEQ